ncbi:MAG TPA: hypothetical protein VK936_01565, partial [Longimicrobiales bacterium]|nr:hypothetical protein [Longimicrobiales bacterium]
MSGADRDVRGFVRRTLRTLRREALVAFVAAAAAVVPVLLLLSWLWSMTRPSSGSGPVPLLLDVATLCGMAATIILGVRWSRARLNENAVAAAVERRAGMSEGSVRGVLELGRGVPAGTSAGLARRAEAAVAERIGALDPRGLAGDLEGRLRRIRRTALATLVILSLAVGVIGFAAPERSRMAWAPLASPLRAMTPVQLPPIDVLPGDAGVIRGEGLDVRVRAPGRTVVTLRWRTDGDVAREEVAAVTGDSAQVRIPRIDAVTVYWVEAPGGADSRRFRVTPIDPLMVAELDVQLVYPAHVRRPAETFRSEVPPLDVPAGTRLLFTGRATQTLAAAGLVPAERSAVIAFAVNGEAFEGEFLPTSSGIYAWRLAGGNGDGTTVLPAPLRITIVPDAAPVVEISLPSRDTLLHATLRQAVAADARDDHGLVSAALVSWRVDRHGRRGAEVHTRLDLGGREQATIQGVLDGAAHDILPGDTLKFLVRVTDNSPARQSGESRIIALHLPGPAQLRQRAVTEADALAGEIETVAADAAAAQRDARSLEQRVAGASRRGARSGGGGADAAASPRPSLQFRDAADARRLVAQQEDLMLRAEELRRRIDELERAMELAGLQDAQLRERLEELRRVYDDMLDPGTRQQVERLRDAAETMDADAAARALSALAAEQGDMQARLEQGVETARAAAEEQRLNSLAQEARELATQQHALAAALADEDVSPDHADAQRELAERARGLEEELTETRRRLEDAGERAAEKAAEAADAARDAARRMGDAARNAEGGQEEDAARQAAEAAADMDRTAEAVDDMRQAVAEGQQAAASEGVRRAVAEALALAERQEQLAERMRDAGGVTGAEQADSASREAARERSAAATGDGTPPDSAADGATDSRDAAGRQMPRLPQLPRPPELPRPGRQPEADGRGGRTQIPRPGQQSGDRQGAGERGGQRDGQGQQAGGQQSSSQEGREGRDAGRGRQSDSGSGGERAGGGSAGGGRGPADMQALRSEQVALQQGLQQLSRNLQDVAERTTVVNRDVGAALARAGMSMQQTLEALQRGEIPLHQAEQSVESLNRLALTLLSSAQQMDHADGPVSPRQAMPQIADMARRQGSLAGQSSALVPMNLSAGAVSDQLDRLAAEQLEIARRLDALTPEEREAVRGDVDGMAAEARTIAGLLGSGALAAETAARQERLFHRLLDAGRALQKDELEETRTGERPRPFEARRVGPLDAALFREYGRHRTPSAAELDALPPAYR